MRLFLSTTCASNPSAWRFGGKRLLLAFIIWCLNIPHAAEGKLHVTEVLHGADTKETTYDTSTYVYFGPQAEAVNESTLVYATSLDACAIGEYDRFGDAEDDIFFEAIVVAEVQRLECRLSEIYERVENRGASTLVLVTRTPLGSCAYMRDDWDDTLFMDHTMPLVQVLSFDIGKDVLADWHKDGTASITARIDPEHVTEFQSLCTSLLWTIVMRVLLPACALWTSLAAAQVSWRHRFDRSAAFWICCIEVPPNIYAGFALATGMYGPYSLPYEWFLAFATQLTGFSVFTTYIMALVLHEKTRGLRRMPQRDVFKYYHYRITGAFVACIGSDVSFLIVSFTAKTMATYETLLIIMLTMYFSSGLIIGFVYYIVSRTLQIHLRSLIKLISLRPTKKQLVRRMATILSVSNVVVFMWLISTGASIFLNVFGSSIPLRAADPAIVLFSYRFVSSVLRISFSYAKVQIFSTTNKDGSSITCFQRLQSCSFFKNCYELYLVDGSKANLVTPTGAFDSGSQDSSISSNDSTLDPKVDRSRASKADKLKAMFREESYMATCDFGTLGDEEGMATPRWLKDPSFTPRGWGYYPDSKSRVFPGNEGEAQQDNIPSSELPVQADRRDDSQRNETQSQSAHVLPEIEDTNGRRYEDNEGPSDISGAALVSHDSRQAQVNESVEIVSSSPPHGEQSEDSNAPTSPPTSALVQLSHEARDSTGATVGPNQRESSVLARSPALQLSPLPINSLVPLQIPPLALHSVDKIPFRAKFDSSAAHGLEAASVENVSDETL